MNYIKAFKANIFLFVVGLSLFQADIFGAVPKPELDSAALAHEESRRAKVILVLGTSSSGKSTISNRLKANFPNSCLVAMDSMDDELDQGITKQERLEFPREWLSTELCILCKQILKQADSHSIIVVDAILQEITRDSQVDQTASFITYLERKGFQVYSLLVHCPIARLVQNVSKRNADGCDMSRRSPVAVVGEYIDNYISPVGSPSSGCHRSPFGSPPSCGSLRASIDGEVAAFTGRSGEFIDPSDFDLVLKMFSQMQVDPSLEKAKNVLLEKIKQVSARRTPSPVIIAYENYNFIFNNRTPELFETEFSRLISAISMWVAN